MSVRRAGPLAALLVAASVLAWHAATRPVDFAIYHRVATQVLAGDLEIYPAELFEPARPADRPAGGAADEGRDLIADPHGFRYAPAVAFLFVPLGLLPLEAAALLFFLLKAAALVVAVQFLVRHAGEGSAMSTVLPLALFITAGYLVEEARNGNFHLFMVCLMVVAYVEADRGRISVPAVALAVAIAAKLLPLVLLGYFAMRRRFAVCLATLAVLGALAVLPAAVAGVETNTRLLQGFVRYTLQKADEQGNHSLRGALVRHLTPHPPDDARYDTSVAELPEPAVMAIWLTLGIVGAGVLGGVTWRAPRDRMDGLLDLSLLMTAMLLASPHTQRLHFSALVVPVVVLLLLSRPGRLKPAPTTELKSSFLLPPSSCLLTRATLVAVCAAGTLIPALLPTRSAALIYEALSPHTLAAVLVGVTLLFVKHRRESGRLQPAPATDDAAVGL